MRVENIDFAERRVRVKAKGSRFRFLMLPPRLIRVLGAYLGDRQTGYVLADGRMRQEIHPYRNLNGSWYTHYRTYDVKGKVSDSKPDISQLEFAAMLLALLLSFGSDLTKTA
jgi:integrase